MQLVSRGAQPGSRLAWHEPSSHYPPASLVCLQHAVWPTHRPIWHSAIPTEVQGPWHGGSGVGGEVGAQAGDQAEGQVGPAAEQDIGSGEAQGAQDDEQEPTLGRQQS